MGIRSVSSSTLISGSGKSHKLKCGDFTLPNVTCYLLPPLITVWLMSPTLTSTPFSISVCTTPAVLRLSSPFFAGEQMPTAYTYLG